MPDVWSLMDYVIGAADELTQAAEDLKHGKPGTRHVSATAGRGK
jgi:hypothetical protein